MYVNVVDESAYAAVGVSLLSAYVANAALEADLGGIEGWGGARTMDSSRLFGH